MKIKQKISVLVCALAVSLGFFIAASPVMAADSSQCGGAKTAIISCSQKGGSKGADVKSTGIWGLLILVLNIMTAGVGILAVGGIVYAAILYASSSDNADQTKRAKQIIKDTSIGILAYIGMYILINFLIPGGVFN